VKKPGYRLPRSEVIPLTLVSKVRAKISNIQVARRMRFVVAAKPGRTIRDPNGDGFAHAKGHQATTIFATEAALIELTAAIDALRIQLEALN
jgi:hypothetical protein